MKRTPPKPLHLSPKAIQAIETRVFEVVKDNLDSKFFLLDVVFEKEAGYWYLRVYVDRAERDYPAVSLDDCQRISQALDPVIEPLRELEEFSYSLEISSPGLFRALRHAHEFEFYQGCPVCIQQAEAKVSVAKRKKTSPTVLAEGILQTYHPAQKIVTLQQETTTQDIVLNDGITVLLNPAITLDCEESESEMTV